MEIIVNNNPVSASAEYLASTIKEHLAADEHVLWLLSGGSGLQVVLATDQLLTGTDLTNLSVTLSDERYGTLGHPDENWQQLLDGGMTLSGATMYRPLIGEDRTKTTDEFGAWLMQVMTSADYTIGLFGIGTDGHTAGIKPHSSAATTTAWAEHFTGDDFERLTMTPLAVSQLDEAVLQASGVNKVPTLRTLLYETAEISVQPAQILKSVPKTTLFTDNEDL